MIKSIAKILAGDQQLFINFLRVSVFVVMAWIGGLKYFKYEANGIVPFVANSPFMSFFYGSDKANYKEHMNKEGELNLENVKWHTANHTYIFSYGLGTVIIGIGLMVLLGIWMPGLGMLGGILTIGMSLVTLSFLITTPQTWVPNLGDAQHGFPYLSAAGRLVIKDIIMMAAGFVVASDAASRLLKVL